jgi:hypothetical protein
MLAEEQDGCAILNVKSRWSGGIMGFALKKEAAARLLADKLYFVPVNRSWSLADGLCAKKEGYVEQRRGH